MSVVDWGARVVARDRRAWVLVGPMYREPR